MGHQCEGAEYYNGLLYVYPIAYDPMHVPGQLRFSLYSGAVITEGGCSSIHYLLLFFILTLSYALCLDCSFLQCGLSTV